MNSENHRRARARDSSPRANRWNTCGCSSAGMPGPSSVAVTATSSPIARAPTTTVVPAGVWVRALASRFASTWCSRESSPRTSNGSSGRSSCQTWSGPAAWASLTAWTTSGTRSTASSASGRPASSRASSSRSSTSVGHPRRLGLDATERVDDVRRRRHARAAGELGVAADRGQRRAQLVARVGDELPHPRLARLPGGERGVDGPSSRLSAAPTRPASVRGSVSLRRTRSARATSPRSSGRFGDPAGGGGDPVERAQRPPDDPRADQAGGGQRRPARPRPRPRRAAAAWSGRRTAGSPVTSRPPSGVRLHLDAVVPEVAPRSRGCAACRRPGTSSSGAASATSTYCRAPAWDRARRRRVRAPSSMRAPSVPAA